MRGYRYAVTAAAPVPIAVGILTLAGEEETTTALVRGLVAIDDPAVTIHVLVNGVMSPADEALSSLARVRVRAAGTNLGVAAGRNRLLADDEVSAAHIVGFLDNDLVPFDDLFDRVRAVTATHEQAQVIGVALFDHSRFSTSFPDAVRHCDGGGVIVERDRVVARSGWAAALASCAWNLGSNVDLAYAYGSVEGPLYSAFLRRGIPIPNDRCLYNSARDDIADVIADGGSVRCGNVPGTAVFFRGADVRERRIRHDERFGPYGAEDVDLCWRLTDAGSENVVVLSSGGLHGTTGRQDERRSPSASFVEQVNIARVRTLLARRAWPHDWRRRALRQGVATIFAEALHGRAMAGQRLLAWMFGVQLATEIELGRKQSAPHAGEDNTTFAWPVTLQVDLLRADSRRFRLGGDDQPVIDDLARACDRCAAIALPSSASVSDVVSALADEATELGDRVDESFDAVLAELVTAGLSGSHGHEALEAISARAQRAENDASDARRHAQEETSQLDERSKVVTTLTGEIARRQQLAHERDAQLHELRRRLDRRVVRIGLRVADSFGRARRRIRARRD